MPVLRKKLSLEGHSQNTNNELYTPHRYSRFSGYIRFRHAKLPQVLSVSCRQVFLPTSQKNMRGPRLLLRTRLLPACRNVTLAGPSLNPTFYLRLNQLRTLNRFLSNQGGTALASCLVWPVFWDFLLDRPYTSRHLRNCRTSSYGGRAGPDVHAITSARTPKAQLKASRMPDSNSGNSLLRKCTGNGAPVSWLAAI